MTPVVGTPRSAAVLKALRAYNLAVVQSHRAWRMRLESLEMRMRVREMRADSGQRRE